MRTQVFCYDDLSRLTWAGSAGTPTCSGAPTPGDTGGLAGTSASYSASYTYDAMNRLTSGPLGSYTYGDSAHADAATTIGMTWSASYDAAGDMTCRAASSATTCAGSSPTGAAMGYDNEGRLASWQNTPSSPTQSASYLYDGAGQRVQQVATASGATTTTSYIGSLEEVTQSGGTTTTTAYYGSLAESVNGALSYLLSDGLGSVSEAVNTSGGVTATQLYAPYGGVRYQSGTLPTDHGYTGQISDATTSGLDYYGARSYDPVAGQFTSADTTLAGGLNRYAYVAGNPETRTDPSGHIRVRPTGRGGPFRDPTPRPYNNPLPSSVDSCYLSGGCFIDHRNKREDPPEHDDGYVLAKYFGLHIVRPRKQNIFGQPEPDYIMFAQIDGVMPGVAIFGQGPKIAMDLYTPAKGTKLMGDDPNDPHLRGAANTIYEKSEQASIVVVDLRNIDPNNTLTKDEVNLAAAQAVYAQASGLSNSSQVVRVLFIRDGVVWDDYNPLDYGPAPAPSGGMPIFLS